MSKKMNAETLAAKITAAETGLKGPATTYVTIGEIGEIIELYIRKGRTIDEVLDDAGYAVSTTDATADGKITVWRKATHTITVKNWLDGQYTVWLWRELDDKFKRYIGA